MAIEITRFELNMDPTKASIVASFDFVLRPMKPADMAFRGWRIIKTKAGGHFVTPPSAKIEDKWFPLVEFQGESQKNLCNKLLELCEPYLSAPRPAMNEIPDAPVELDEAVPF